MQQQGLGREYARALLRAVGVYVPISVYVFLQ